MAIRKRKWTTSAGEAREAWIVDYADAEGKRHIETFARKKEADARHDKVRTDKGAGVLVAPSKSVTVGEAAYQWLDGNKPKIERATHVDYAGHVGRYIVPNLRHVKLPELSRAAVRGFEDKLRASGSSAWQATRAKRLTRSVAVHHLIACGAITTSNCGGEDSKQHQQDCRNDQS
jgi:integrase